MRSGDREPARHERPDLERLLGRERERTERQIRSLTRQLDEIVSAAMWTSADDEHDPEGNTIAFERESLRARLVQARHDLDAVDHARERLRAGTYGRCTSCSHRIARGRLEALPTVLTCASCAATGP